MRWNQLINIVFFFIFFCLTYSAFAQQLQDSLLFSVPTKNLKHGLEENTLPIFFHKLGSEEDAPNEIQGVLKDKKGFLWLNAKGGIYRYDGIDFKKIACEALDSEGLDVNDFSSFNVDKSGNLWAISADWQRLYKYNSSTETFKNLPLLLDSTDTETRPLYLKYLFEDSRGLIWLSSYIHGLNILDPLTGQLSQEEIYQHLPEKFKFIDELIEDQQGNIWAVGKHLFCLSFHQGTKRIKDATIYNQLVWSPNYGKDIVKNMVEDAHGNIWAAALEGEIFQIKPKDKTVQKFTNDNMESYDWVNKLKRFTNKLTLADDGKIWIANNIGGISIFNPKTSSFSTHRFNNLDPLSLGGNSVGGIYKDEAGILWLPTSGGGLNYYNPNNAAFGHFRSIPNKTNTLSSHVVHAFFEDAEGRVWIGTNDGLNKYNRQTGEFIQYAPPSTVLKDQKISIISINEWTNQPSNSKGNLLIGTEKGLFTFDSETAQFAKWKAVDEADKPMETYDICNLVKDKNGTLWANTLFTKNYIIFRFDKTKQRFYPFELLRADSSILNPNIVFTDSENFWFYTYRTKEKALYQLNLQTQKLTRLNINFDNAEIAQLTNPSTIWKDHKNRYWLGGAGLYLLTPSEINSNEYIPKNLTKEIGLEVSSVLGILGDKKGQIWASTNNGIIKGNPEDLSFRRYQKVDGLQGKSFIQNADYKSPSNGDLYFGGNNGFNVFDPDNIKDDTIKFPVVITKVEVFRDSIMQKVRLAEPIDKKQIPSISLIHGDKLLQINYAALHYAAPKQNQYAIQLEGYDADWRYVGNQTKATYTNLDAGNYLFRVKASNKDGFWNEEGTALKIVVHPPWWATWWAYMTYLALVMALLYYLYRFQLHRQQEQAEAKRLKEMDEMKSRFFANISHELRTPLTLLLGPVDSALRSNQLNNRNFTLLQLAQQSGQQLHRLINSILDFSRLEAGKLELELRPIVFYPFIRRLVSQFESNAQIQGIELEFNYLLEPYLQIQLDKEKFEIIINNLLSNALKFTPKGGKIEVQIQDLQNHLQIQVTDTGRGIHPKDLPHIFNRFYQTKEMADKIEGGSGIGLSLSREYALLFNGELRAESELGEGSTFYFIFPKIEVLGAIAQEEVIEKQETSIALLNALNKNKAISSPSKKTKLQILLVEDNYSLRTYIEFLLQEEYGVKTAENGKIALEYLSNNANDADFQLPDLIISDVMMPIMDGFVLLETLKTNKHWQQIPVIMLTARAELRDKLKALRIGVDDYLVKPFEEAELMARISNLLKHYQERKLAIETPILADEQQSIEENIQPDWLPQLEQIIEQELGNSNFSIDDIPSQLAMSRSQFFRAMKAAIGLTPNQYLREMRLQKARQLIENKNYRTVKEIAYQVGFQKTSYFSTLFKNRFGKTPSAYMEKY